ncbi:FAD-dependent oxidoreductase [Microbacterium sp. RD1]|uniref:glycerol-3-phosphate dehydrogenase/oxidase n=1 Tax=Microbacterium sp. RD1 TaxID=3457313 RepID=UPI003FA551D4
MRRLGSFPSSTALNAVQRTRAWERLAAGAEIDVLVVGGGITGAGVALDAASRGLRTVLVERHDLAFGTSRWSSKLVHGGLRYLASGRVGIAYESAAERHHLLTRIAPHLTRPLAQITPLYEPDFCSRRAWVGLGFGLGDVLRRASRTPGDVLPRPSLLGAAGVRAAAPAVRTAGLHGGVRGWDGQLIDDARLVVTVARTAAGFGAHILSRVEAIELTGGGAVVRDTLTGSELQLAARAVINATGVWAGDLAAAVRLRPSRGTHLVVDSARLGCADVSLAAAVAGSRSRFVFTVPAVHGRTYIGLTDVAADPASDLDAPVATEAEVDFLLDTVNTVLQRPLDRTDVLATFAGLRPLLVGTETRAGAERAETSDLSRRHAVIEGDDGVFSVVGGKLTTYRRMAEDAVDAAVRRGLPVARPSRTRDIPLVGAWPRGRLREIPAPARLVRRYGAEAPFAAGLAASAPAARGVTGAELRWAVEVEGALTTDDVLDRRTRLGLVPADRAASTAAVAEAFAASGTEPAIVGGGL